MSSKLPSNPGVIEVVSEPGDFASYAIAKRPFTPGETIAILKAPLLLPVENTSYLSLQVGPGDLDHVKLNSDFSYVNHSCDPSLEWCIGNNSQSGDTAEERANKQSSQDISISIRVAHRKNADGNAIGIKADEVLTFFYPSTEWDMMQSFDCLCGSSRCLGKVRGAKYLPAEMVFGRDYFFNNHILRLKADQGVLDGN